MSHPEPQQTVIRQAARWLALWHSGSMTEADRHKLADWRAANPAHEQAWQQAAVLTQKLTQLPAGLGMPVLDRQVSRRDFIKPLAVLMVVAPSGILAYRYSPWQEWTADYRTATGERRQITLADGSRILLNTATAIDVAFTGQQRRIHVLAGEILIETAPDNHPQYRPFIVHTAEGRLRALGTRFIVRQQPASTHLAVMEGAVEVKPAATLQPTIVDAGMQASLTGQVVHAAMPLDENATAWADGMLHVVNMPLEEFVTELGRYRVGILRCTPDVAHLEVSGVFQLNDTDKILMALENTLPLTLQWRTRYWVTLTSQP